MDDKLLDGDDETSFRSFPGDTEEVEGKGRQETYCAHHIIVLWEKKNKGKNDYQHLSWPGRVLIAFMGPGRALVGGWVCACGGKDPMSFRVLCFYELSSSCPFSLKWGVISF